MGVWLALAEEEVESVEKQAKIKIDWWLKQEQTQHNILYGSIMVDNDKGLRVDMIDCPM